MEEMNNEENKKETVETAKETTQKVDVKKEAKGFITAMYKDPFAKIKEIVDDKENKSLKIAITLIVIWTVVVFIKILGGKNWSLDATFRNMLSLVKSIVAPALGILVLSGIVYVMNKKEKKSIVNIITAITIAQIPTIIAVVVSLLTFFSISAYKITTPIASLCTVVTTILTYFTIKTIMQEEENAKFIKTFVIVEAIYYVAYIIIAYLGIYI